MTDSNFDTSLKECLNREYTIAYKILKAMDEYQREEKKIRGICGWFISSDEETEVKEKLSKLTVLVNELGGEFTGVRNGFKDLIKDNLPKDMAEEIIEMSNKAHKAIGESFSDYDIYHPEEFIERIARNIETKIYDAAQKYFTKKLKRPE